jgi:RNA polymerase sigma factor for flagellar operon FliA
VDTTDAALEAKLGRPPTDEERRRRLGWTRDEYLERTADLQAAQVVSFPRADDGTRAHQERDPRALPPWAGPCEDDLFALLERGLNRDERAVLVLYYRGNVTMKRIGLRLGLSEARVCQMHADMLLRLRERLGEYDYAGSGTTSRGTPDGG